ncbi:zinc-nutrition responsive transporter [Raphidocelis subcapitata]|uniref:Zinc-nutrition responsive transporter n=1 Tax=Raphidocelis subcapitata TaxID=307507 RepID=A0A2V0NTR2_9CHLO|nr:zinc-nutrition responsive transporter [Raphidocelis subcapitata]|eukprot:GBF90062.1 zinc-nutrition responsive transporter [Raphidocelis subcapitata]
MISARRALMGLGHLSAGSHAGDEHDSDHLAGEEGHGHGTTLDLRIISIFAIAAGAALCGLPPLFMRAFQSPDSAVARVARAFAGGIILALALVHIVPEAVAELAEVVDFPIGGVTVLFGVLALVVLDSSLTAQWAPEDYKRRLREAQHAAEDSAAAAAGAAAKSLDHACPADGKAGELPPPALMSGKDVAAALGEAAAAATAGAARAPHTHACASAFAAQRWLAGGAADDSPLAGVKQKVTAYSMELGCIFHSVIIGVGVGVITTDRRLVLVLMIALVVHQGLEGLSLGAVLALTRFPTAKKVAMVLAYAVTTSIGIAIGIGVSASYDPESVLSKAVQGTLNGVSGGMLLYISMYQLIAEEFSREDLVVRPRLRLGMALALLAGAGCMCLLAIWS